MKPQKIILGITCFAAACLLLSVAWVSASNITPSQQESTSPFLVTLKNITAVETDTGCSLSIIADKQPTYTVFKLSNPERLVIDLPSTTAEKGLSGITIHNKLINTIEPQQKQYDGKNFLRLEIGLNKPVTYTAKNVTNSLLINLTAKKSTVQQDTSVVRINDVSFMQKPQRHIVITADNDIKKYFSNTLKKPNRLVIDIPKAESTLEKTSFPVDDAFVERIRVGQNKDMVRIVTDFTGTRFPLYQIAQQENRIQVNLSSEKKKPESNAPVTEQSVESEAAEPSAGEEKQADRYTGEKISLDFKDADIKNVFRLISDISGLNIIVSENVSGKVTLKLENIPWDEVLDIILETNNLGKITTKNIMRIETRERIKKINLEKLQAKESQENLEDLVTKTIDVSYAKASKLSSFIKKLNILSPRGSINSFDLTNKITIQDIPDKVLKAEKLVKEQDVPTRQVLIEAKIVQSNPSIVKELGIKWGGTYNTTEDGGKADGGADISLQGSAAGGSDTAAVNLLGPSYGGFLFGYIKDKYSVDVQLSAMESDDKIKIVSNPKILGLDNKEARIKQGVALPYLKLSEEGVTSTEFKDAVIELKVTPKITPANTISLHVYVTKNQKSSQTGAGNEPGIDIREVETDLLIESGKTAVIGGIYETTESENVSKVPVFGDLPYLGRLFRNEKTEQQLTELLVFITVTIVEGSNAT